MQDFRKLDVWEKSHRLTIDVYKVTKRFPDDERFGLTSRLRRAAASIPANLPEGCGRGRDLDFGRFVQNAMGSGSEVEYHFLLARDLGYLPIVEYESFNDDIINIKRMLTSLLRRLRPGQ
jgi:four helix bundle protein